MSDVDDVDVWRSALDSQLPVIQENLLLNPNFYGYLIQKRIFTQDTIEDIESEVTTDARILRLVGLLKRRDNDCFDNFLSILVLTDHRFIKEKIEQAIRSERTRRRREDAKSSELLRLKDKQIDELEQELNDLRKKFTDAERMAKEELDRSKHYLEVINCLTAGRSLSTHQSISIDDRESEMEEMEAEIDSLNDQVVTLEARLQETTEDLDKTKFQLNIILKSEKKFRKSLGLDEGADEMEVTSCIQEMRRGQTELKLKQMELERISEQKDAYLEKVRKLTQDVHRMDADRRRKDLQLQRIKRNKDDNHVLLNARSVLNENKSNHPSEQRVLEEMNLPRIEIGTRLLSARNSTISKKFPSAPDLPIRVQLLQPTPNSTARGNYKTSSNEPRYCVLCRKEYFVRESCRIHTAAKRDGRYMCCNAAEVGVRAMGCRTLNSHLYVQVSTGVGSECRFYDQQGRLLCFQENEEVEEDEAKERISFLSGR